MDPTQDILARLSALEATLKVSLDGLKSSIERIENTLKEDKSASETRLEKIEERVGKLEQWRVSFTAKVATIGTSMIIVWTLFGNAIQNALGVVHG